MTSTSELEQALVERIHREGPLPFDAFVETALYGDGGFFSSGHGAGRAGADFVTSPEVGQLFGALVAAFVVVIFALREGVEAWRGDACTVPVSVLTGERAPEAVDHD